MRSPSRGRSVPNESGLAAPGPGAIPAGLLPGLQGSEQREPFLFVPSAKFLSIKLPII